MKESILIYLIGGLIYFFFSKKIIKGYLEEEVPYVNPNIIEAIMLIVFLVAWFPLLLGRIYIVIKTFIVTWIVEYRLWKGLSPRAWKILKEEMDKKRKKRDGYRHK